jgi:hypothetical protein
MFLDRLKAFIKTIGSTALGILALYAVVVLFSSAAQALGGPALAVPLLQNTLVDDASVPLLINYQGTLRDPEGEPLSGYYTMTFRLYDDIIALPDAAVWSEEHISVTVRSGLFNVLLGNSQPFGATFFNSPDRFIGVTVDPYDEMVPRQRFASVPYAIYADRAYSLSAADGDPHDAVYVDADGEVGIGTTEPLNASLHVQGPDNDGTVAALRIESVGNSQQMLLDGNEIDTNSGWLDLNRNTANGVTIVQGGGDVTIGDPNIANPSTQLNMHGTMNVFNAGDEAALLLFGSERSWAFKQEGSGSATALKLQSIGGGGNKNLLIDTDGNVGIGTLSPAATLDVNGDLNISGDILNFVVSGPVSITSFNGEDTATNLGSTTQRICFLTRAGFGDLTGGGDNNVCRIEPSGGQWRLTADSEGSGNVFCSATCLSW